MSSGESRPKRRTSSAAPPSEQPPQVRGVDDLVAGLLSQWLVQLTAQAGWQKAVVALANKNARILWAVLCKGKAYDLNYVSIKPGAVPAA